MRRTEDDVREEDGLGEGGGEGGRLAGGGGQGEGHAGGGHAIVLEEDVLACCQENKNITYLPIRMRQGHRVIRRSRQPSRGGVDNERKVHLSWHTFKRTKT